jgi:hypothetical protein
MRFSVCSSAWDYTLFYFTERGFVMEEFKISDFAEKSNYNPYPPEFAKGSFIGLILLSVLCFLSGVGALCLGFYDTDNFAYALVMAAGAILGGFLFYHNARKLLQEHREEVQKFKMAEAFRNEHEGNGKRHGNPAVGRLPAEHASVVGGGLEFRRGRASYLEERGACELIFAKLAEGFSFCQFLIL